MITKRYKIDEVEPPPGGGYPADYSLTYENVLDIHNSFIIKFTSPIELVSYPLTLTFTFKDKPAPPKKKSLKFILEECSVIDESTYPKTYRLNYDESTGKFPSFHLDIPIPGTKVSPPKSLNIEYYL